MIVSLVCQVTRKPLSVPAVLLRRDTSKDAHRRAGSPVLEHARGGVPGGGAAGCGQDARLRTAAGTGLSG